MNKLKILYVPKKDLYPAFSDANGYINRIRVRKDLPTSVKKFVLSHEIYHIKDWNKYMIKKNKNSWIFEEIKANLYGGFRHPLGFLFCIILSLHPSRIKLYIDRLKLGKKFDDEWIINKK